MFKSLRLRIQVWHALILSLVIAVFGIILHRQMRRSIMDEIDSELLSDARVLGSMLRLLTPNQLNAPSADIQLELPRPLHRRPGPPRQPVQPESSRNRPPPPPRPRTYFAVFSAGGTVLYDQLEGVETDFQEPSTRLMFRDQDQRREVLLRGPSRTLILVGRDVKRVRDRLYTASLQIILGGCGVLAFGLLGGWWLAGKAIAPIYRISETAAGISAENLSERIETTSMDHELRGLATTLNLMFVRLEAAFDQQSRFTADASHELRTPISVLLSQCELSLRRTRSIEDYKQTIATCLKTGGRMQDLVESLLTLARVDAGSLPLCRTEVDLQPMAAEVKAMLMPLAKRRSIGIDISGTPTACFVDGEKIRQVIINLVHNAILYNRPGGTIRIETGLEQTTAILTVSDTGMGIPENAIPHLFERFFRVDESRTRQADDTELPAVRRLGSGLGLAICKGLVDLHSGTISVESQTDRGSTFTITLPSAQS